MTELSGNCCSPVRKAIKNIIGQSQRPLVNARKISRLVRYFVDNELQKLQARIAVLNTARAAYFYTLKDEMAKKVN